MNIEPMTYQRAMQLLKTLLAELADADTTQMPRVLTDDEEDAIKLLCNQQMLDSLTGKETPN
ncbi:MAG: hypothetical protein WBR26_15100 [Candidatus Acidiferrum sp.]